MSGKQYSDIMLDVETLGTSPNAPIVSLGVVQFNAEEIDTWDSLTKGNRSEYYVFNTQELLNKGCKVDANTIFWWLKQSEEARAALVKSEAVRGSNSDKLDLLNEFCSGKKRLWGNGASFDNVLLRQHFALYDKSFTMPYNADYCYRTVKNIAQNKVALQRYGIHHDPVADAITQVIHLQHLIEANPACFKI